MGRRRRGLFALALAAAMAPAAAAQRVTLQIDASQPVNAAGQREPVVAVRNLLQDPRWLEMLQNSLPIRLQFTVEVWRVRPDWFDALEQSYEWQYLIEAEPLTGEFTSTRFDARGASALPQRFATLRDLDAQISQRQRILLRPTGDGEYYFGASLQIRTMTDREMTELERFLQGEAVPRDEDPERRSALGRAVRSILLRLGGLPQENLEARTGRFRVTRDER